MGLDDVLDQTALEQAALIRAGAVSSEELVRAALDRIEARNPTLQAFVATSARQALSTARKKDAALSALRKTGGDVPMFHGVPTAIKDLNFVRGMPTRLGSRASLPLPSPIDDRSVAALRRAGFVLLGKTATSEVGAMPVTEPDIHPPTRNPWDPAHSPGGSSGGAAAAVAAGLLPIAHGSDGGGSIRLPSSFCHLYGFKPSRGRVRNAYGLPDRDILYTCGPIARSVLDAAALLDVMAGLDIGAPHWAPPPPACYRALVASTPDTVTGTARLRIRFSTRAPIGTTDAEVKAAVDDAVAAVAALGHEVEEGALPEGSLQEFLPLWQFLVAGVPLVRWSRAQPITRWLADGGRALRAADVATLRARLAQRFLAVFEEVDVWLTPTSPLPPPRIGAFSAGDPASRFAAAAELGAFTAAFNVTGQPAASVPIGVTSRGLPIGLQIAGRRFADDVVLSLSRQIERSRPWRQRRPPQGAA